MSSTFICSNGTCTLPVVPQINEIIVHGAYANNLKHICFSLPKGKLVTLTGLSGSGKSSIALNVLASESVRQFLDSMGMVTDHVEKSKVEAIMGLSPAITVSQRQTEVNPRSTVGTKTGISTILRNLFATLGRPRCTACNHHVTQLQPGSQGIVEDGKSAKSRKEAKRNPEEECFSCPNCGSTIEKPQMGWFSASTSSGNCESCQGRGELMTINEKELFDLDKNLLSGGVRAWDQEVANHYIRVMLAGSQHYGFSLNPSTPLKQLGQLSMGFLKYGLGYKGLALHYPDVKMPSRARAGKFKGVFSILFDNCRDSEGRLKKEIAPYIDIATCEECHGSCLSRKSREVRLGNKSILDVNALNLNKLLKWLDTLDKQTLGRESIVLSQFIPPLEERIANLRNVGLDYLSLHRPLVSLSVGETQRLKMSGILGSALTGVLYIFDEPTTGLHPKDISKLMETLERIRALGNTVLVIEHNLQVIKASNVVIEVGPGRGSNGGQVIAVGSPKQLESNPCSITGRGLKHTTAPTLKSSWPTDGAIHVIGACENNLKNVSVRIPIRQLTVVTGVSGSGKSTFLFGILDKVARRYVNRAKTIPGAHCKVEGLQRFKRVITINQATIGRTHQSRSNVATYTKLFDHVRKVFANQAGAKAAGLSPDKFSFNASDERCERCHGTGLMTVDMAFMDGVQMSCPVCDGMRFNEKILSIRYKGKSIAQVLALTVSEAKNIFIEHAKISKLLGLLTRIGLEHLTLGQSTAMLSGGEAQRIKLATELWKSGQEETLFLLDEATAGLHYQEVESLMSILEELVANGHTVVTIEHNLSMIARANHIVDFGPGGGSSGGEIVASGAPVEIVSNKASYTGESLSAFIGLG